MSSEEMEANGALRYVRAILRLEDRQLHRMSRMQAASLLTMRVIYCPLATADVNLLVLAGMHAAATVARLTQ